MVIGTLYVVVVLVVTVVVYLLVYRSSECL